MKNIFILSLFFIIITPIFSQSSVRSFSGDVTINNKTPIIGQILSGDDIINVKLNGQLIILQNNSPKTIGSTVNKKFSEIQYRQITISGKVERVELEPQLRHTGRILTAAARASSVQDDIQFEE